MESKTRDDYGQMLESLRFTTRTLREAADFSFEAEVRKRVLRAATRLERVIESMAPETPART